MKDHWTRREFMNATMRSAATAGALGVVFGDADVLLAAFQEPAEEARVFDNDQRDLLKVAVDVLIPARDGMPAASEVGTVNYIDALARELPEVGSQVELGLRSIDEVSAELFDKDFGELTDDRRTEVLVRLKTRVAPRLFAILRDSIYEAYYTNPTVWERIGYEFYPAHHAGLHMDPFDPELLSPVREMPPLYKEVD